MSIFQAIYVSTATEPLSSAQLRDLLITARQRNRNAGISGLLLYANRRFIQVLEGPEDAVRDLLKSIQKDYRHKNVDALRLEKKDKRHFPDWQMGFRDFTTEAETLPIVSRFLEPDFDVSVFNDDSNEAYRILLAFRDVNTI